ncbi:Methyltransferase-like protein 22 [Acropora cervicornis]|uniref:Methyltransferase-like protein 22 n=1 Tax=Acropora cervicornis TaxID=6130 RepID=A0AAD9VFF7_ACRCE|nr:Methyltransferase-like protein 22 [Acropora cervicornis]
MKKTLEDEDGDLVPLRKNVIDEDCDIITIDIGATVLQKCQVNVTMNSHLFKHGNDAVIVRELDWLKSEMPVGVGDFCWTKKDQDAVKETTVILAADGTVGNKTIFNEKFSAGVKVVFAFILVCAIIDVSQGSFIDASASAIGQEHVSKFQVSVPSLKWRGSVSVADPVEGQKSPGGAGFKYQ